jgi:CheY-like chemotaxis protein
LTSVRHRAAQQRVAKQSGFQLAYETGATMPVVLVVEDEPMLLLMASDLVEEAGFLPIRARNADEAISLLESRQDIRIIFTDVDMPPGSMNGLKLALVVRGRWPPIEIIVTSGHVQLGSEDLPERAQFHAKPYDSLSIIKTMHAMAA